MTARDLCYCHICFFFQLVKRGVTPLNKVKVTLRIPYRDSQCRQIVNIEEVKVRKLKICNWRVSDDWMGLDCVSFSDI